MDEFFKIPENKSEEEIAREKEQDKQEMINLAAELSESREALSFPGIDPESYAKLKAVEEEFPGFATPIDELIERLSKEGFKVVFSADKASGNIFILPKNSDDIENDGLFPRHLAITNNMPDKLKRLIEINKRR